VPQLDDASTISRRAFLHAAGIGAAGAFVAACDLGGVKDALALPAGGRLSARPTTPTSSIDLGEQALSLGDGRDGLLYVPAGYVATKPAPLVLMLHGATGSARGALRPFRELADGAGLVLLAPESRGTTWDAIRGPFGADVQFIDRAMEQAFDRCNVNPKRLAIGGFSDGATYALSLGLDNGTLFTHVMAFSPGFTANRRPQGRPRIFISHGRKDDILPIDVCSRRIVPALEDAGYGVTYKEFDGPHTVPQAIAQDAFTWFVR
jgi:phospholipase/carboxylesterase